MACVSGPDDLVWYGQSLVCAKSMAVKYAWDSTCTVMIKDGNSVQIDCGDHTEELP